MYYWGVRPLFERWNEKVNRTETCWLWTGALYHTGYGRIQKGRRGEPNIRAHRFAYEHYVGPIPEGLHVRHSCHVRSCVNPAHLSVGTRAENMADMTRAGRWEVNGRRLLPARADHPMAKLTEEDVAAIRASNRVGRELAAIYGVNTSTINRVRSHRNWK